jgi:hypothetical protein
MADILTKYCTPSRYNKHPHGTQWITQVDNVNESLYIRFIQVGSEEEPKWITIGDLLKEIFSKHIHSEEFIQECLNLYTQETKTFNTIIEIIKKI